MTLGDTSGSEAAQYLARGNLGFVTRGDTIWLVGDGVDAYLDAGLLEEV